MNIAESFAEFIASTMSVTLGTNLFIGGVPLESPDVSWWVVLTGGTVENKNQSGEVVKRHTLNVFYRDTNAQTVYDQMNVLEKAINASICTQLTDFDTIDMSTIVFPADQDIDDETRTVGTMQVQIKTYYKE